MGPDQNNEQIAQVEAESGRKTRVSPRHVCVLRNFSNTLPNDQVMVSVAHANMQLDYSSPETEQCVCIANSRGVT